MGNNNGVRTAIIVGVIAIIAVVAGISYALWQISFIQSETNVISTACFSVEFEDGATINLTNTYPMSDDNGKALEDVYTFTLSNACNNDSVNYVVNLETLIPASGTRLENSNVKVYLEKMANIPVTVTENAGVKTIEYTTTGLVFADAVVPTVASSLSAASASYYTGTQTKVTNGNYALVTNGVLTPGKADSYKLRVWVSDSVGVSQTDVTDPTTGVRTVTITGDQSNSVWNGVVTVNASYKAPTTP